MYGRNPNVNFPSWSLSSQDDRGVGKVRCFNQGKDFRSCSKRGSVRKTTPQRLQKKRFEKGKKECRKWGVFGLDRQICRNGWVESLGFVIPREFQGLRPMSLACLFFCLISLFERALWWRWWWRWWRRWRWWWWWWCCCCCCCCCCCVFRVTHFNTPWFFNHTTEKGRPLVEASRVLALTKMAPWRIRGLGIPPWYPPYCWWKVS